MLLNDDTMRKATDPRCCLRMLYALEGAVLGIRWQMSGEQGKAALKAFEERGSHV